MALLVSEGFDKVADVAGLTADGWTINAEASAYWTTSYITLPGTDGRFGGRCLRYAQYSNAAWCKKAFPSHNLATGRLHAAGYFRYDNTSTGSYYCPILGFMSASGSNWVGISMRNGTIYAFAWDDVTPYYSPSSILGSWSGLTANAWHHIEMACTVADSGGEFKVWVDGTAVINFSGDTKYRSAAADNVSTLLFGPGYNSIASVYFDDIICWDETGETPNTAGQLGEHRIWTLSPEADDAVQFTPNSGANNYSRINESPNDGGTSYTSSTTVGHKDVFTLADMTVTPDTIYAVVVKTIAKKTGTGATNVKGLVSISGTQYEGAAVTLTTSYAGAPAVFGYNPATSAAWTATVINAMKIGYGYSS